MSAKEPSVAPVAPETLNVGDVVYVRSDIYAIAVQIAEINARTVRDMQDAARAAEARQVRCNCDSCRRALH